MRVIRTKRNFIFWFSFNKIKQKNWHRVKNWDQDGYSFTCLLFFVFKNVTRGWTISWYNFFEDSFVILTSSPFNTHPQQSVITVVLNVGTMTAHNTCFEHFLVFFYVFNWFEMNLFGFFSIYLLLIMVGFLILKKIRKFVHQPIRDPWATCGPRPTGWEPLGYIE